MPNFSRAGATASGNYSPGSSSATTAAQRGQRPSALALVECIQQRGHLTPSALRTSMCRPGKLSPVPVTLSANKNELEQLGRGLGLAPMHPVELAQTLHERLNGARVVAHLTAGAFSVSRAGLVSRKNVHFDKPVLSTGGGDNFNAGLALGLLNGMEMGDCLAMGNAVSGWYVSHGASPTLEQAAELMRSGAYDEELTEV